MKKIMFSVFVISMLFSITTIAQISKGGRPKSFDIKSLNDVLLPELAFMGVDETALLKEDEKNNEMGGIPYRFGVPFYVNQTLLNSGKWNYLDNGDGLWRLTIKSKGAYSINLVFDQFNLPEGSELFIYNADRSMVIGAFTSDNNQKDGKFGIQPVAGEEITIEYYEPINVKGKGIIGIAEVIHGYRQLFDEAYGFGTALSCHINMNCALGASWQNQKRSVALIVAGGGLCSGALVNNTSLDATPYLLTADHCFSGSVSTWVYVFNYESPNCTDIEGPTTQTVSGSTLKARNTSSDFLLVELNNKPPLSYNVHYAGWSKATAAATSAVGIHHPAGDIKKISNTTSSLVTSDWNSSGVYNHWRITGWANGTTEGGSSGSPLFDQNGRIVGQLHGGSTPACPGSGKTSLYGKFDASWNTGATSADRLRDWLDPTNSGVTTLDGTDLSTLLTYCSSASTSSSDGLISNVNFGTIANNSGAACASYTDFTSLSTNISPGLIMPLSITTSTCGVNNTRFVKAFIDWNADADFNDIGELVATSTAITNTTPFNVNINISGSAIVGTAVRMRIVCMETASADNVLACGSYAKGETEDYNLNVTAGTTYSLPITGNTSITACSGVLYDNGGAAGNYSNNCAGSVTINPSVVGNKVSLTFTSLSLEDGYDFLYIYNGVNTAAPLIGMYSTNPGTVYATGASGALTVLLESDVSYTYAGFEANIACVSSVPQADLITQAQTATPTSVSPGGVFSASCAIFNQGLLAAASSAVGYYLSTDNVWDVSDVLLGSSTGGSLASGVSSNKTTSLTIPGGTTIGSYYILYYADYLNVESESNETNNVTSYAISVIASTVDLIIQTPSATPTTAFAGSSINVSCLISNQGTSTAATSSVGYYLSTDNVWDAADVFLTYTSGSTLLSATSATRLSTVTIPGATTPGSYYILYFADYAAAVGESNEANNVNSFLITISTGYLVPFSGTSSITSCSGTVYDNGGTGNYSNGSTGSLTINPSIVGNYIRLDFTSFSFETCCDRLYIYDGTSIGATLIGTYTTSPGVVYATNASGALTLRFTSDGSVVSTGFAATISCVTTFPQGDLIMQTPTASPTSVVQGGSTFLTSYIYNQGVVAASSSTVGYYLSTDNVWDASDVYLTNSTGASLAATTSSYRSATAVIPALTVPGAYYILYFADYLNSYSESNETNNVTTLAITVTAAAIDLIITSPSATPLTVPYGGSLSATCTIQNQGTTTAASSAIGYYLSTDNVWDVSDVYLNFASGSVLTASSSSARLTTLTIPGATSVGNYYILYFADYANAVAEVNETNNVNSIAITVTTPTIDLLILTPTIGLATIPSGGSTSVSSSISNQGNVVSASSTVGYYLSTDNIWDASDVYLTASSGGTLNAGNTSTRNATITIPGATPIGSYYILYFADYANSVAEVNEANNVNSIAITVTAPTIDLLIQSPTIGLTTIPIGTSTSVFCSIYNQGNFVSPSSTVGYYLSTNNVWDVSDVYLAASSGSSLGAGSTSSRSTTITIPGGTTVGSYFILYFADYASNVTEANETNNVNSVAITVTSPVVDLIIQSPSLGLYSVFPASTINANCYIYNQGTSTSASSTVGYYLSTNITWDASDIILSSSSGTALAASNSSYRSANITIPANTAAGAYYILYFADYALGVSESIETNNVSYLSITVNSGYVVPYSGSNSITTCSGTLYDNGGLSNYSNSSNGSLTIYPSLVGNYTQLNFTSFSLESCCDYVRIYDGINTSAPIIGTYTYSTPGVVSATNSSGALTVYFYSDGSSTYSGFQATISCVTQALLPDLTLQSAFSTPTSVMQGNIINVSSTAINQGSANANSTVINYYLSTDNVLDASDAYLSYSYVTAMPSLTSSYESTSITIPSLTATGSYYLLFSIDPLFGIIESDETNNVSSVPITIGLTTIDMIATAPYLGTPILTSSGINLPVFCTVFNQGSAASGSSRLGYYLSSDPYFDGSDIFLSYFQNTSLSSGGSMFSNKNLFLPIGVNEASYIIIYADYDNDILEINENNNYVAIPISPVNGLNDFLAIDNSFSIYPNPNNGSFNVNIGNAINQNCKISILNSIGEEVSTRIVASSPAGLDEKFLLERMASGLYTIKIEIGEETWFRKVSVEK